MDTQSQLQDLRTDLVHTAGDIADSADGGDFRSTATYWGQRLRRSSAVMPVRNQQLDGTVHREQESMEREVAIEARKLDIIGIEEDDEDKNNLRNNGNGNAGHEERHGEERDDDRGNIIIDEHMQ